MTKAEKLRVAVLIDEWQKIVKINYANENKAIESKDEMMQGYYDGWNRGLGDCIRNLSETFNL